MPEAVLFDQENTVCRNPVNLSALDGNLSQTAIFFFSKNTQ